MRYLAVAKGFSTVYPSLHGAASDFRSRFMSSPLCKVLERNNIRYFTRLSLVGGEVVISVTDDEFMLIQLAAPAGIFVVKDHVAAPLPRRYQAA